MTATPRPRAVLALLAIVDPFLGGLSITWSPLG
jgi:hypothetical protein